MRHIMFAIVAAAAVGLIGIAGASAAPANGHAISQTTDHSSYVPMSPKGAAAAGIATDGDIASLDAGAFSPINIASVRDGLQ